MSRASGTVVPATGTDIGAASPAGASEPFLGTYRVTNMIAVQNYMASGATFLQSLLDGHPGILNTPAFYSRDIHGAWIKGSHFPAEDGIDKFIRSFPAWFDPRHVDVDNGVNRLGDNGDETSVVDADGFRQRMRKILEGERWVTRRRFLEACHLAYALALGRKLENDLILLFPVHTLPKEQAARSLEDYPDGKFLYTVRSPLATYNSIIRRWLKLHLDFGHSLLEAQFTHFLLNRSLVTGDDEICGDRPYFPEHDNRFRAVRLEDIHQRPEQVMKAICRWVGLDWHPCLLESTFNGRRWTNKPTSRNISGFSPQSVTEAKLEYVSVIDRLRLDHVLNGRAAAWRYTPPPPPWKRIVRHLIFLVLLWLPFRAETVRPPSRIRAVMTLARVSRRFPEKVRAAVIETASREKTLGSLRIRRRAHEMVERQLGVSKSYHVVVLYTVKGKVTLSVIDEMDRSLQGENVIEVIEARGGEEPADAFVRFAVAMLVGASRFRLFLGDYARARACLLGALKDESRSPPDRYVTLLPLE